METDWLRILSAMLLVIGMIGAGALFLRWLMQRGLLDGSSLMNKGDSTRQLKVLEQLTLDPRRRLLRVQAGERELLVLLGPDAQWKDIGDMPIEGRK